MEKQNQNVERQAEYEAPELREIGPVEAVFQSGSGQDFDRKQSTMAVVDEP